MALIRPTAPGDDQGPPRKAYEKGREGGAVSFSPASHQRDHFNTACIWHVSIAPHQSLQVKVLCGIAVGKRAQLNQADSKSSRAPVTARFLPLLRR